MVTDLGLLGQEVAHIHGLIDPPDQLRGIEERAGEERTSEVTSRRGPIP